MGKLLTAHEVVTEKLQGHVTKEWLLLEAQAGRVPCLRLGPRKVLFDSDEIDAWVDARRIKPEALAP